MKRYKLIKALMIIAGIALSQGCVKLDENPRDFISPTNFYKTEGDALAAVTAAYRPMGDFSYYLVMHIMVDNASDNSNEGRANLLAKDIDQFTMDSGNGQISNFWDAIYSAVNSANAVTEYVPGIDMNEEKRDQFVAEAKFLRALSYFNLVRLFGGVPLITKPAASLDNINQPRATEDEVYTQIIKDLEEAVPVLPVSYPAAFKGRVTKAAAQALLSKVYLTRENWAKAIEYSKAVIDANPQALFADEATMWSVDNQDAPEFIFSLQAQPNVGVPNFLTKRFMPRVIGGTAIGWIEMSFYNSFQPGDKRKEASCWTTVNVNGVDKNYTTWSDPFPHIGKYKDGGPNFNLANGEGEANLPVIRFADVLLIYAEALNESKSGPDAEAYSAVNKVRRRAYGEDIYATVAQPHDLSGLNHGAFFEAVLQERSWELCFEWDRWFDLKRTGKLIEVMKPSRPLVSEKSYVYPIPQAQILVNPNLTQNKDY